MNRKASFSVDSLSSVIEDNMREVQAQLEKISGNTDISIGEMFSMQIKMNHLNQMTEMCSSVVHVSNQACSSMLSKLGRT